MTSDEAQYCADVIEQQQGALIDALRGKAAIAGVLGPLRPAYALLAYPFPVPKPIKSLRAVLMAQEAAVIKTMAFHHVIPPLRKLLSQADRARVEQLLAKYDDPNIVPIARVEQSPLLVREYLREHYPALLPQSTEHSMIAPAPLAAENSVEQGLINEVGGRTNGAASTEQPLDRESMLLSGPAGQNAQLLAQLLSDVSVS